jgi:hypothetical protein
MNAIHQNNMGVIAFEDGKLEDAINLFRESLSLTKLSIMRMRKPDGSIQAPRGREPLELRASPTTPSRHCEVKRDSLSNDDGEDVSRRKFIYLRPMRIYAEEDFFGEDDHREQQLLVQFSLFCTFNLALASHTQAIRTPDKDAAFYLVKKAMMLYELAYELLLQEGDLDDDVFIVELAILNNVGMIHKHCQRTEQAHECFEELLSVLMCLTDSERVPYISSASNGSLDGFFSNIIRDLGILKRVATAPSA